MVERANDQTPRLKEKFERSSNKVEALAETSQTFLLVSTATDLIIE